MNVGLAIETGVAGLSIEDAAGDDENPLSGINTGVDRNRAARAAIDQAAGNTLLVGRAACFAAVAPKPVICLWARPGARPWRRSPDAAFGASALATRLHAQPEVHSRKLPG